MIVTIIAVGSNHLSHPILLVPISFSGRLSLRRTISLSRRFNEPKRDDCAMETVIMASRVALLILVTGLFAVMWSGDQPDLIAAVDRPAKVLIGTGPGNQRDCVAESSRSVADCALQVSESIALSTDQRLNAPLPDGISEGTFLVVDQSGRTEVRVVSRCQVISDESLAASLVKNHYVVEEGRLRWHYVRLDETALDFNVQIPTAVSSLPATGNR